MGGHSNYKLRTMDMLVYIQDKLNENIKDYNHISDNERNERHKKWENIKRKDKIEKHRLQQLQDKDIQKKDDVANRKKHKPAMKKNIINKDKKSTAKEIIKRNEDFADFLED